MIPKKLFIAIIKSLRDQEDYDRDVINKLQDIYGGEINPYDNSKLTGAIFSYLSYLFPDSIDGIKIFCYELDYGRNIKTEGCAIDELWEELQPKNDLNISDQHIYDKEVSQEVIDNILNYSKNMVSTHPLIDDYPSTTAINDIEVTYQIVSPVKKIYRIEEN